MNHIVRGLSTGATVAIIAAVIVIGGVAYFNMYPEGEIMMKKGDAMMDKGTDMMQKGDAMAKEGDAMMKDGEKMMGTTSDAMMKDTTKKDSAMMGKAPEGVMMSAGQYIPYDAAKLSMAATGKVVLFFRASWCPTCRGIDADIKAHLKDIPKDVTILDVNYDDSAALKQKYGVTYQHTFVQVDAKGNQIAKWSGSPTLTSLVGNIK